MSKYPYYKNQVVPDKLNDISLLFQDEVDLLNKLKKAKANNETVYGFCYSVDDKTGEIELSFIENNYDIIGYVLLEDIAYKNNEEVHIGRGIDCVDSTIGVKILEVEDDVDGLIKVKCSRREVSKETQNIYNNDIKDGIFKDGLTLKGIITGMDHNKVYVDVGGDVTAILGVADIAKVYVRQPSDILEHGQVIDLVVKKAYADPIKISLSRAMLLNGWESIDRRFKVGKIVPGIIKNSMATGLFVELSESFEGIAEDIPVGVKYNYGDRVKVRILTIDKRREKIKLKIIENK